MLNFGQSFATFLGLALAIAGVGLYFLRSIRPELARDHDIFFAAISLVCGLILLFQGWRLDPILAFSQYLLAGSAVFFAVENIRLRGVTTEQAKRNTPIVDEERPVSRNYGYYEAELEEISPVDDWPDTRRISGSRETRNTRNGRYENEERRRPSSRSSSSDSRIGTGERGEQPRKRRPRPPESRPPEPTDEWGSTTSMEDRPSRTSRNRPSSVERERTQPEETISSRPRRRPRPSEDSASRRYREDVEATPTDYVDYQPVDTPDGEEDNSRNFDV